MPTLSVIVPVLNEADNVRPLFQRLNAALAGIDWEVVYVDDDSADGTAEVCRSMAMADVRVRLVHRVGRYGLASACIEGILATTSPYLAVMDGDLQHDETLLPTMLRQAQDQQLDLVVGTRSAAGGSMGEMAEDRVRLSNLGRTLSRMVTGQCELSDPMSGFFLVERRFFQEVVYDLSQLGFKILLDIVASSRRPVRFAEVGYTFRTRQRGQSKLDSSVGLDFLLLVADKLFGRFIPVRYGLYALVGLSGVCVHMLVLGVLYRVENSRIIVAQACATLVAMVWNFCLNNWLTYRDRRLKQAREIALGLVAYVLGCSVGALVNLGTTSYMVDHRVPWYAAGFLGMVVSSVWNYGVATVFTWKLARKRRPRVPSLSGPSVRNPS